MPRTLPGVFLSLKIKVGPVTVSYSGTARIIVDNVATHSVLGYRRVLNPYGIYVQIGSINIGNWFAVFKLPLEGKVLSPFMTQEFILMGADLTKEDLANLSALMESGKVTPVIDRRYKMSEAAAGTH